jgi:hypothetical protein
MADSDDSIVEHKISAQSLWEKYEDIAMHFNGLLLRLRSQALAGIAALSTVVGIFTKEGNSDVHRDWLVATAIFIALALFWVAIWCLDILYYNRLLMGAVEALVKLEDEHKQRSVHHIHMSTHIDGEFSQNLWGRKLSRFSGVLWFYGIVFVVISAGALFSGYMYYTTD